MTDPVADLLDYATPTQSGHWPGPVPRRVSWAVMLVCLYAPYAWVVLMRYPWDSYRWLWVKLWPILPGLIPGVLVSGSDVQRFLVMGGFTVVTLVGLGLLLRRRRPVWVVVPLAMFVLAVSGFNSWVAYAVFND